MWGLWGFVWFGFSVLGIEPRTFWHAKYMLSHWFIGPSIRLHKIFNALYLFVCFQNRTSGSQTLVLKLLPAPYRLRRQETTTAPQPRARQAGTLPLSCILSRALRIFFLKIWKSHKFIIVEMNTFILNKKTENLK